MEDRGRKIICHSCRNKFYKDELIQITKTKRICFGCNKDRIDKDSTDYNELIRYICQGFNIDAPNGRQLKDIKRFNKELGYSYQEIQYTLYYIYNVLKRKPEGTSIGLVPYYYEKAKEHFLLVQNAKRTATKINIEEVMIERNINNYNPKILKTRLINIEDLI